MNKNKKGFTLIELLAVIVILAIIALIATPIVLNIINNSKESAALRSAELYIDTVEKTIVEKQMNSQANLVGTYEIKDGNLYQNNELKLEIKVQNSKPTGKELVIDKNGKISEAILVIDKYQFNYNGEKIIKINSVESTTNSISLPNSSNGALTDFKIYGNSIQGGTPSPTNPIEVKSVGDKTVNLFNKSNVLNATMSLGKIVSNDNRRLIWIPCEPNTTYTISKNFTGNSFGSAYTTEKPAVGVAEYDYKNIGNVLKASVTTGADAKYLIFVVWNNQDTNTPEEVINSIQVQLGNKATDYEPYNKYKIPIKVTSGSNTKITNIYLDEPLRKIGDSADYIDFKNQRVVRNVLKLKLDGSKSTGFKNDKVWHIKVTSLPNELLNGRVFKDYGNSSLTITGLSNRFIVQGSLYANTDTNKIYLARKGDFISIPVGLFETEDSSGFLNYFKSNPTYILGAANESYEEKISLPSISIPGGNTTIEVLSTTHPSKLELNYNSK